MRIRYQHVKRPDIVSVTVDWDGAHPSIRRGLYTKVMTDGTVRMGTTSWGMVETYLKFNIWKVWMDEELRVPAGL